VIVTIKLRRFWIEWSGDTLRKLAASWTRALGAAVTVPFIAITTADVPAVRTTPIPAFVLTLGSEAVAKFDPRINRLEKFFKIYHCPSPHHIAEYLRAADGYGLDYRLLPAVSIRETRCGATGKQGNNHWGYHRESFSSIEAGIDFLARRLTQNRTYRGKTLRDKLFTYNPRRAYPEEIKQIMRQIE
jgi:hypothetical protein